MIKNDNLRAKRSWPIAIIVQP